jgi:hypothetical protein
MATPDAMTWDEVLDLIEGDVERAEALLTGTTLDDAPDPGTWAEPSMSEPLPAELHERARRLVRRQEELLILLPRAQSRLRKQQAFTNRVRETTRPVGIASVYIDASA